MGIQSGSAPSYQRLLRALGAFLDQRAQGRFSVIEVPDGFTVLLEPGGDKPDLQEVHFTLAQLMEQFENLVLGRRFPGPRAPVVWGLAEASRQDFLRALGYELDDLHASSILIDELEDSVLVTYRHVDPALGYQSRKQTLQLGRDQIKSMLEAAYRRRTRGGFSRS